MSECGLPGPLGNICQEEDGHSGHHCCNVNDPETYEEWSDEDVALELWRRWFVVNGYPYHQNDYGDFWCAMCDSERVKQHHRGCTYVLACQLLGEEVR